MKTIHLIILVLFIGCEYSANKVIDKYPSGQTKMEYHYSIKGDTSSYICKVYYESGVIKYTSEISDGMFLGEKISYYDNGTVKRVEKLEGLTRLDDERYDCHVTNYRSDGTKESEYQYLHGEINGLVIDYDSSGLISRTRDYENGKVNGEDIAYFANEKVKSRAFVKNDTLSGFVVDFDKDGDTLKWFNNLEYGVNGVFRKKWLDNGRILTGSYGDTLRSYVIWTWFDKDNRIVKSKVDKSKSGQYTDPE